MPTHSVCERNIYDQVVTCHEEPWNPNNAQVPCEFLPPQFIECITHSFDKFQSEFENGTLPMEGCPNGHKSEYIFGNALCHPLDGIECIGEKYWINNTYPCYEDGEYSILISVLLSFLLGFIGADRFYLGYYFLGFIKLFTCGGFVFWWIIDFILLILGKFGPIRNGYSMFY